MLDYLLMLTCPFQQAFHKTMSPTNPCVCVCIEDWRILMTKVASMRLLPNLQTVLGHPLKWCITCSTRCASSCVQKKRALFWWVVKWDKSCCVFLRHSMIQKQPDCRILALECAEERIPIGALLPKIPIAAWQKNTESIWTRQNQALSCFDCPGIKQPWNSKKNCTRQQQKSD